MRISRSEAVLGLLVPLVVIVALVVLALGSEQPAVPLAFLAAVPMFSAMFARALVAGIVAAITVVAAAVTAAATFGQDFSDAIGILIGVIVGAGAAVLASQAKAPARPRPVAPSSAPAALGVPGPDEPDVDDLTGLPTRRGALTALAGPNTDGPRVVAVIDCDRLAALNDEYGRAIGDTFLFAVAGRTRYALAEGDMVARWDGEEFVVSISGDLEAVRPTLELITDKVNKNPIRTDAGLIPASMSVGAAPWPPGVSFDDALTAARRALYRAKSEGGACLVVG